MPILSISNSDINNLINSVEQAKKMENEAILKKFQDIIDRELNNFVAFSSKEVQQLLIKSIQDSLFSQNDYAMLMEEMIVIIDIIKASLVDNKKNMGQYIRQFLYQIRKTVQNPAYQQLKYQEVVPAVHFLHAICLASYTQPIIFDAFTQLGKELGSSAIASLEQFSSLFRHSRDVAEQRGLMKDDLNIKYIFKFPRQAWGGFLGTHWGKQVSTLFGLKKFDPRAGLGSGVGAFYQEKIAMDGTSSEIISRTIYTPSPTIGDELAPEAHALLQSMENHHGMEQEILDSPSPYLVWVYTNLQNFSSRDEKLRAEKLMQLNQQYPLSFRGITITQDSQFYRAGLPRSRNERAIVEATFDPKKFDAQYVEAMRQELCQECNFHLTDRGQRDDPGYYFPNKEWQFVLSKITQMAYGVLADKQCPEDMDEKHWNWCQKAAYRELVHLAIIRYQQIQASIELMKKYPNRKIGLLQSIVCKESMDRGGKTNACLLLALGEESSKLYKDVFSACHARALLSRRRLILADRMEPMLALTVVMKQIEIQQFLKKLTEHFGVKISPATLITDTLIKD